jgi:phospho-N-acetylmuramoyl-pentapeptide-transferase
MLYWLSAFSDTIGPLNVLRYITFRTGGAMFTALVLVFLLAPYVMAVLGVRQVRPMRSAGLIILSALLIATLLWANLANGYVWIVLAVALGFGFVGLRDDYLEAARQSGLSVKVRIALAAGIASVACLALVHLGRPQTATSLSVPFGKEFDLGWLYIPLAAFIIVAAGNIVNLADRLYGFVIGPLLLVGLSFGLISWFAGNSVLAHYLNIRFVPGVGELAVLCGAVTGAGLGFFWFNAPPASIFLGATGSLALGGMFGAVAVATKHEVVLAVIYGLFVTALG